MQPQSLTATEAKLLSAFRALPANTQMRLFRSIDELAEAIEDEQDAQEADRILARIRAGEEETVPFDEVVKVSALRRRRVDYCWTYYRYMASYTIIISRSAQKELSQLPGQVQQRIINAIYNLEDGPLPPGVKKLKGREAQYRIRIGDYRVIYTIDGGALIILILKIAHRQEAYE